MKRITMKPAHRVSIATALLALTSMTVGVTGVQAGSTLVLMVDVDETSFVGPPAGEQGPFNVEGDTGGGAGSFQCWGWIFEDTVTTNVSQIYNIDGRGAIMTQGREGGFLAVVGGTGDFRNVRGEALQTFTGPGFDFTIEFNLTGTRGE